LAEYAIAHPVAVDGSLALWGTWHVSSWPTVFVLDANGRVVWSGSGEPDPAVLASFVDAALDEGERLGALKHEKIAGIHPESAPTGPLSFPSKVIALAGGGLAVSDSAHQRVVLLDKDGKATDVVGSGLVGKTDGTFGDASFHRPGGLAEAGDLVYVADTENHEIRAIDRKTRTVTTVAGTGELGHAHLGDEPVDARSVALRSPWDLAFVKGTLYVALAGSHQIGALDPASAKLRLLAGSGRERREDGVGAEASFAQPSGLASDGKSLFVADAETSSVRTVDLAHASVATLVGEDLFVFGDVDGKGPKVRLKHPIGIAYGAGALWIADTYNSKVKRLDPATKTVTTFAGGADRQDLYEPQGLAVRGGDLVVADTNHHRIALIGVTGAKGPPRPLVPGGLAAPASGVAVAQAVEPSDRPERVDVPEVAIAANATTDIHVSWQLPTGTGVNDGAPFRVRWRSSEGLVRAPDELRSKGADVRDGFDVAVTPMKGVPGAELVGDVDVVVCDVATHRVCVPVRREIGMSFRLGTVAGNKTRIEVPLPEAKP
jgi:sugar lactone lactonase YvrE